jgi:hypothetical protein
MRTSSSNAFALLIFGFLLFFGLIALAVSQSIGPADWFIIVPFCVFGISISLWYVCAALKRDPYNIIFEPLVCFAIASAVYYSFGPLLYVFGPQEAAEYSLGWYPITARSGLWLTGLNFVGIGITGVISAMVRFGSVTRMARGAARRWSNVNPNSVAFAFILIGMLCKFFLVIPYEFGATKEPPSAVIRAIQNFSLVGIFISYVSKSRKTALVARLALAVQVLTGVLMFNKTEVLLGLLSAGAGIVIAGKNIRNLIYLSVGILAFYIFLGPLILFGRNQLGELGGDGAKVAGLLDRAVLVREYLDGHSSGAQSDTVPGLWWSRLNYLPAQQAAVDLNNAGRGSDDFKNVLWIFVPRTLFPEKPILSQTGANLTEKVKGFSTSSTGIGIFADGYYNLGWIGVLIASITYGLALSVYRNVARPIILERSFLLFPLALIGTTVALRPDGWWLLEIAGPMVLTLAALFAARMRLDQRT